MHVFVGAVVVEVGALTARTRVPGPQVPGDLLQGEVPPLPWSAQSNQRSSWECQYLLWGTRKRKSSESVNLGGVKKVGRPGGVRFPGAEGAHELVVFLFQMEGQGQWESKPLADDECGEVRPWDGWSI